MKTYLINTLKKISLANQSLNIISILKSQEWIIFNENKAHIEKIIFLNDEKLLISFNGKSIYSKWKYIKFNSSLIIEDESNKYLCKIITCNNNIVILNIDSTNYYCFLINSKLNIWKNFTFSDLQWYLIHKCDIDILTEEQRFVYNKQKIHNESIKKKKIEDKRYRRNKLFNKIILTIYIFFIICIITNIILFYIDYKKRNPNIETTKEENKIAIDLGLSVNWASCNVGANSPEETGNYYGWGEPTGKDVYDENESLSSLYGRFPEREDNTFPQISIINTSYDIAKYNWGGKWRMPTVQEFKELISKCRIILYESNGKNLAKVIGPNGNFIILPSTGFIAGTEGNFTLDKYTYSIYLYAGNLDIAPDIKMYESSYNSAPFLYIGNTYKNEKSIAKIDYIDRYQMLPVRAVIDK